MNSVKSLVCGNFIGIGMEKIFKCQIGLFDIKIQYIQQWWILFMKEVKQK
ncbi:unnamed protein product [Paramecium primaurelia]|uniref:Uncharacterized protein n=1 Tax=Paramecium primaurelia TaxID=5886 RepID=A0A8S1KBQ8_PARPR|nr:unnamed protein product [Paramecium primaurelia]